MKILSFMRERKNIDLNDMKTVFFQIGLKIYSLTLIILFVD